MSQTVASTTALGETTERTANLGPRRRRKSVSYTSLRCVKLKRLCGCQRGQREFISRQRKLKHLGFTANSRLAHPVASIPSAPRFLAASSLDRISPLAITVAQFLFTILTSLFHQRYNCLKAWVVIYPYNHRVRLLSPSPDR